MQLTVLILPPSGGKASPLSRPERVAPALDGLGLETLASHALPVEGAGWAQALQLREAEGAPLSLTLRWGPSPLAGRRDPALQQSLELAMATTAPEALQLQPTLGPQPAATWALTLRLAWALAPRGATLVDLELLRPLRRDTRAFFLLRPAAVGEVRSLGLARAGFPELRASGLTPGVERTFVKALRPTVEAWLAAGDAEAEVRGPGGVALERVWGDEGAGPTATATAATDTASPCTASPEPEAIRPGPPASPGPAAPSTPLAPSDAPPARPGDPAPPAFPPLALAALSLILPGVGQIVLGQTGKGVLLLALTPVTLGLLGLLNLFAAVDAYLQAGRLRRGEPVGPWSVL
ncbi:MAG: hypothetical protein H6741_00330 [Alphaproteobacteria bacterium]|nr:hypothetical protein [Alphaproteobacteria bacterium]